MLKKRLFMTMLHTFPHCKLLRKEYNKQKFQYHNNFYLPAEQVKEAERSDSARNRLMEAYQEKWKNLYLETEKEIGALLSKAPTSQIRTEIENTRADMLFCRFAYGFKPDEYLAYRLLNKTPEERKKYVSSRDLLCMIYRLNDRLDYDIYNDKAQTYDRFAPYYKREAVSLNSEKDYEAFLRFIKKHPVFVKKNVREAMGNGVELIDMAKTEQTEREVFDQFLAQGKTLLEERVVQCECFSALNPSSVNTVRFITYYTKTGVEVPYCFMKIGRNGSFVDNGGAGGILVGIDKETGCLNTDGFDEFIRRYEKHPDSGIPFVGYQLPAFKEGVELSKKLSAMTPSVKFVGWDFTYTDHGWVVIEGNGMSQLIGPQIVWEKGVKKEVEEIMGRMELIV